MQLARQVQRVWRVPRAIQVLPELRVQQASQVLLELLALLVPQAQRV